MLDLNHIGSAHKSQIINIVRRSLSYIDRRLIDHGERVAYIAHRIAEMDPALGLDREKLLVLCLLHDIGAYKTEEIDRMVQFETDDSGDHARYGYVFLSHTASLGPYTEAILHHHTRYDSLPLPPGPVRTAAELICLADRIDILMLAPEANWEALRRLAGTAFSPYLLELFFTAEAQFDISGHIRDGSYGEYIQSLVDNVNMSGREVLTYLQMLVFSIDFRSPFTVTHTANTTAISALLARLFGLEEEEREAIAMGAFLHDIGKIAIPYSILENTGRLSPEEMAVMRTHVAVSQDILSGIVPEQICQIAVRHHEKLNGNGYHQGLSGQELTLAQRIVAVADILSALIGRRSYKEPFPKEKALAILAQMSAAGEICPRVCAMATEKFDYIITAASQADDPIIELYENIRRQYGALQAAIAGA